jgi:hypothetical protein
VMSWAMMSTRFYLGVALGLLLLFSMAGHFPDSAGGQEPPGRYVPPAGCPALPSRVVPWGRCGLCSHFYPYPRLSNLTHPGLKSRGDAKLRCLIGFFGRRAIQRVTGQKNAGVGEIGLGLYP